MSVGTVDVMGFMKFCPKGAVHEFPVKFDNATNPS